ncbi:PIG-L deacetylase family protein [Neorhizobium alkalisoli]|uniref:PIG-L deacetylase family protein n=1 Tax=Neorhizobium alkalisoli TaxID=528178 RepID=UPI000CF8F9FA|nr:PIG-L deacetylase family protein [Neorhizobium alkalisoli]
MKVLALGAHPDDIEIFMFGALAAWKVMGADLIIAIATDGAKGGAGDPVELARTRRKEAQTAADLLSADLRFLDFPDGALVADSALDAALKALIDDVLPDIVITHGGNDYHGDHRALSEAVALAASFTAPVIYADTLQGVGSEPFFYVDISEHFALKAQAIRCHVSQDPERFVLAAGAHNAFRAGQCNAPAGAYAEAYSFKPIYPFVDIRAMLPPAPAVRPVRNRSKPR